MKTNHILSATLIVCSILVVTGCKKTPQQDVKVQFINACTNTPYLDYYLQGSKRAEFIGYGICSNSNTANIEPGNPLVIEIKNPNANNTTVVAGSYTDWDPNKHYTFVMYGDYSAPKYTLLNDSVDWPAPGKFKLRFMNFCAGAPALDLLFNNDTVGYNRTYFGTDSTTAVDSMFTLSPTTFTVTLKNHATGQVYQSINNMGITDNRILDVYAVGLFADTANYALRLGWAAH